MQQAEQDLATDLGIDPDLCQEILNSFPPHLDKGYVLGLVRQNRSHIKMLADVSASARVISESLMSTGIC